MYEKISVKQFIDAWFFEKYETISKDDFEIAYTEYIDATGLFTTREFDLVCFIHFTNNKLNIVRLAVGLQRQYLEEFGEPFLEELNFLIKFGYRLKWENDKQDFINQLDKVIRSESKYRTLLNAKRKQLDEERKKAGTEEPDKKKTRVSFLRMMNTLGKIGYKVDKDITTVEELSLMIKQQFEEQEELKAHNYGR
jgi:hypothetical protein